MSVISGVDNRKQTEELTMAHFIIMDVMIEEFHGNFAFLKSYLCFMFLNVYEKIHQKWTASHVGYVCYVNNVASACEDFHPQALKGY